MEPYLGKRYSRKIFQGALKKELNVIRKGLRVRYGSMVQGNKEEKGFQVVDMRRRS